MTQLTSLRLQRFGKSLKKVAKTGDGSSRDRQNAENVHPRTNGATAGEVQNSSRFVFLSTSSWSEYRELAPSWTWNG
jgi:hypothetical protein